MAMNWNGQLPPGWEARWDRSYGRYYFVNHGTLTTTWNDPRLHVAQQNQGAPAEQIPLQDFSRRQPSTSAQSSSTARSKETGFQYSIDSRNDEDDEDDEWRDALLRSQMESDNRKHLPFHEKVNMKEKFKREFKELDSYVVESTVEKHDYDDDMARATLASLKDAQVEKQRKKRAEEERKRRQKEQEENRKTRELREKMEKMKKELKEKNEAERKAKLQAERQRSAAAANQRANAFTVGITKLAEQKVKAPQPSRQKVAKEKTKTPPVKKAPAQASPRPTQQEPVYVSPNRLQPAGPQASLRKGPDRSYIARQSSNASGPNRALVTGPQRTNRQGASAIQPKLSLCKGPQASIRQGPQQCVGPQASIRQGPQQCGSHERSFLAGEHSRFVSAV